MLCTILVTLENLREVQRRIDWLNRIDLRDDGVRKIADDDGTEYLFPPDVWHAMLRGLLGCPDQAADA